MWPLLLVAFIVVPLIELAVILQVGEVLGVAPTIVLLLVVSFAGAVLVKREGWRAWRNLVAALQAGRIPAEEVVDGALVVIGGALLLTPGFVTDLTGLFLVIPPTRHLINRLVRARVRRSFRLSGPPSRGRVPRPPRSSADAEVVDVEVLEIHRDDGRRP